jgi:hypothetical protein
MNPRKPLCFWQFFAQALACAKTGFASTRVVLHDGVVVEPAGLANGAAPVAGHAIHRLTHCDPFPNTWPSPFGVGPFLARGTVGLRFGRNSAHLAGAGARGHGILAFVSTVCALESGDITTPFRGTPSCGKSSSFFLSQRRSRAACKTPARAGLRVLSWARPLRTPRMKTLSQALPLAGLPALRPAPFRARLAADQIDLTARAAVCTITPAIHGDFPRGWSFHFRPASAVLT